MKNPVARPQGIKFEITKYTDIRHSYESRNPEKKAGFRIKCGMTENKKPRWQQIRENLVVRRFLPDVAV